MKEGRERGRGKDRRIFEENILRKPNEGSEEYNSNTLHTENDDEWKIE